MKVDKKDTLFVKVVVFVLYSYAKTNFFTGYVPLFRHSNSHF